MENSTQETSLPPVPVPIPVPTGETTQKNTPEDSSVNKLAMFMIAGVFVLILLGGILIAAGPKKDNEVAAKVDRPVAAAPTPAPAPSPTFTEAGQNSYDPTPVQATLPTPVPPLPAIASIALNSDNLSFDVNNDNKLDINDIAIVSSFVDTQRYAAVYDFNSDSVINVADLAEIRSAYEGYPAVEFDVTYDGKLDINDIAMVSSFVDTQRYAAVYDFNSDAVVDVKDLAMIRSAIALAGTAAPVPMP